MGKNFESWSVAACYGMPSAAKFVVYYNSHRVEKIERSDRVPGSFMITLHNDVVVHIHPDVNLQLVRKPKFKKVEDRLYV